MTADKERRDRIAYLRLLAVHSLVNYAGGFAEFRRVNRDIDSIIESLWDIADPAWTSSLFKHWTRLEIMYAARLAEDRHSLTAAEETDVRGIVGELLAELRDYQLAFAPGTRPEEGDTVRLRRSLPEQRLFAGSTGTIAVDYKKYLGGDEPHEYEVEFTSVDGATKLFATLSVDDLELVSRPGYGPSVP
jgi:hypothetical protein